jgi:hypothetical protein
MSDVGFRVICERSSNVGMEWACINAQGRVSALVIGFELRPAPTWLPTAQEHGKW